MHADVHLLREELDQKAAHLNPYLLHRYQVTRLSKALEMMEEEANPPEELTEDFKSLIENIQTDLPVLRQDINQYDKRFRATFKKARMHYDKSAPGRNMLIGMFVGVLAGITASLTWHLPVWTNSIGMIAGGLLGFLADLQAEQKGKVL
jgi:hypothetical protein